QLLDVAREFADFPITLEAARECLQDVFDVPGLVGVMRDVAGRKLRMVEVETPRPSPFARSLLFGYVGAFLYEGDAPLAERRASLDRDRGRRPGSRRARCGAAGRAAARTPRAGRRPARRPGVALRPHARAVPRRDLRGPLRARRVRGRAGAAPAAVGRLRRV